jgi:hypothetical protein
MTVLKPEIRNGKILNTSLKHYVSAELLLDMAKLYMSLHSESIDICKCKYLSSRKKSMNSNYFANALNSDDVQLILSNPE